MKLNFLVLALLPVLFCGAARSTAQSSANFKKVFIVIFENEAENQAITTPFLKSLAAQGARLADHHAITHPSYPNYLALTSGSTWDVTSDSLKTLDVTHLGDLLEAKGKTWKVYAEGYPGGAGNCFLGETSGKYARRHVPFLSYKNIQANPERCAHIVNAEQLKSDIEGGRLADYTLYVPDNDHNGHDTGVRHADAWFAGAFGPWLKDKRFTRDLLLIVTFDEDDSFHHNQIYTVFWGESVVPGSVAKARYDHYSILRTIEDAFDLGTLGREDARATPISGIWR